jgi:hypothetical protein
MCAKGSEMGVQCSAVHVNNVSLLKIWLLLDASVARQ